MPSERFPEGTTARFLYTLRDKQRRVIDLTGAQLTYAVYAEDAAVTGSVPPAFTPKEVGSGVALVNAAGGVIRIDWDPAESVDRAGIYDWELQLLESNGDKWLAGEGKVVIRPARRLDTA
jgi:hypothetical protein